MLLVNNKKIKGVNTGDSKLVITSNVKTKEESPLRMLEYKTFVVPDGKVKIKIIPAATIKLLLNKNIVSSKNARGKTTKWTVKDNKLIFIFLKLSITCPSFML